MNGALKQANLKPEAIEDLYFGNVLQAGVGQSPARQVVLGAGMPDGTEATTINKVRYIFGQIDYFRSGFLMVEGCRFAPVG